MKHKEYGIVENQKKNEKIKWNESEKQETEEKNLSLVFTPQGEKKRWNLDANFRSEMGDDPGGYTDAAVRRVWRTDEKR